MSVLRFESNIAGEFAYLSGKRDGPILMWAPGTTTVRFGFNRPGGALTRVAAPERFGGSVHNRKEFRAFATKFHAEGSVEDGRGGAERVRHPHDRSARRNLDQEAKRRRAAAKKQRRNGYGQFA